MASVIRSFRKSKRLLSLLTGLLPKHILRVLLQLTLEQMDAVLPSPKKVIKALYDYTPQGPGELRFEKGDFFHVVSEDSGDGWFDATNPATARRGMVPVSYFEVFDRAPRRAPRDDKTLYAVTLYDFKAEREDELDIVPGENLVICAHHNHEWFVAKPINRLGGPGLVPALYVKIVDLAGASELLDVHALVEKFRIPTVEQWKDVTAKYQALTIPLGSITAGAAVLLHYFSTLNASLRLQVVVTEALVELYHLENGRYQYLVVAHMANGKTRHLHRFYQDFYDLQVKLLELFPLEAGKTEHSRRIIPSIPGPLINVNDLISKLRREKLDLYLRSLVALPSHISRADEVLQLFDVQDNGVDREFLRFLKPVSRQLNSQQDRLLEYGNRALTPLAELRRWLTPDRERSKVKVKFYYEDDIFVLLLPTLLRLNDLRQKLAKRLLLGDTPVTLFLKSDYDEVMDADKVALDLTPAQRDVLFASEIDDDSKFRLALQDKCKIVIL